MFTDFCCKNWIYVNKEKYFAIANTIEMYLSAFASFKYSTFQTMNHNKQTRYVATGFYIYTVHLLKHGVDKFRVGVYL